jgi:charged multivesicular body protein 7
MMYTPQKTNETRSKSAASSPPLTYPAEWSDEQVMKVLFSPFRDNRDVNPRSWDSKMKFWTDMVRRHCQDKLGVTINARQLPRIFQRNGQVPSCLTVVLDDLVRQGAIIKLSDYQSSSSWLSWSVNWLVKKPVTWGFSTLVKRPLLWTYKTLLGQDDGDEDHQPKFTKGLPDEQFVVVELVKTMADAIYRRHNESVTCQVTDHIVGYATLRANCRDLCADDLSFDLAVGELTRRKLCNVVTDTSGDKIITMHSNQFDVSSPISDSTLQIYKLKTTAAKLEELIVQNTNEIEQCRLSAKACLQQGKKQQALRFLKRKKMLDMKVTEKEKAVDKINELICTIQETDSQKKIMDAYSSGVEAFKGITSKSGLTLNKIDSVMSDIQDAFDSNEEITQAVSQRVGPVEEDDDELEQELDDLLAAKLVADTPGAKLDTPGAKGLRNGPVISAQLSPDILNLPDVPQHDVFTPQRDLLFDLRKRLAEPDLDMP